MDPCINDFSHHPNRFPRDELSGNRYFQKSEPKARRALRFSTDSGQKIKNILYRRHARKRQSFFDHCRNCTHPNKPSMLSACDLYFMKMRYRSRFLCLEGTSAFKISTAVFSLPRVSTGLLHLIDKRIRYILREWDAC